LKPDDGNWRVVDEPDKTTVWTVEAKWPTGVLLLVSMRAGLDDFWDCPSLTVTL
jgi:hypothetical protein